MTPFAWSVTPLRGHHVVALRGELDLQTSRVFRTELLELAGGNLVLDLDGLTFLDSSGLSLFVAAYRHALATGARLGFQRVPPFVARVLALTRLDEVIPVVDGA